MSDPNAPVPPYQPEPPTQPFPPSLPYPPGPAGLPGQPAPFGQPFPPGQVAPQGYAVGAPPGFPAPPVKRKRTGLIVGLIVGGVVLLAACGVGAILIGRVFADKVASSTSNANVNDCLAGTTIEELNADKLKVVSCTDPTAAFKVVQIAEEKTYDESQDACTDPSSEYVFWTGKEGQTGTVLCLATV